MTNLCYHIETHTQDQLKTNKNLTLVATKLRLTTPVGSYHVGLSQDGAILHITTVHGNKTQDIDLNWPQLVACDHPLLNGTIRLIGTKFQCKVWRYLLNIQTGTTTSYGRVAQAIGHPKAARAVGQALNKNPISLLIPCHRVISHNRKLTGYAGGINKKSLILDWEQAQKAA